MNPRYNIAPGQVIPVIRAEGVIDFLNWGFQPTWMAMEKVGQGFINVRAETAQERPTFKNAIQKRRCLVPLNGYFEWKPIGRTKQPYYIYPKEGGVFAAAGIWENETCAILTRAAPTYLAHIHARMPFILPKERYKEWLNIKTPFQEIGDFILESGLNRDFVAYPVTPRVNNPKFDGPECIQALQ